MVHMSALRPSSVRGVEEHSSAGGNDVHQQSGFTSSHDVVMALASIVQAASQFGSSGFLGGRPFLGPDPVL